jgi:predicted flavoprotein YhiN
MTDRQFETLLGVRILHDKNYQFTIFVNWLMSEDTADVEEKKRLKQEHAKNQFLKKSPFRLTNRLWESLVLLPGWKWRPNGPICQRSCRNLGDQLTKNFSSEWKSTFKEEFVTAGGIG